MYVVGELCSKDVFDEYDNRGREQCSAGRTNLKFFAFVRNEDSRFGIDDNQ